MVWLEKQRTVAATRYDALVTILEEGKFFPSSPGVIMNDEMNAVLRGNTLCNDGDPHDQLRKRVVRPAKASGRSTTSWVDSANSSSR